MTAPVIATDVAVLNGLTALRRSGAPGWASLRLSVAPNQVWIYFADPGAVGRWRDALCSQAEVVFEEFPEHAVHFHSATVEDTHPGWCIFLASRVERVGMRAPSPDTAAHVADAHLGAWGEWP